MFDTVRIGLRHVEIIARVLGSDAAGRPTPAVWAEAETILAAQAAESSPSQLLSVGTALIDALDQDGPEPDDRPPASVNRQRPMVHLLDIA